MRAKRHPKKQPIKMRKNICLSPPSVRTMLCSPSGDSSAGMEIDVDSSAVPTFLDPARIGVLSLAGGAMTLEPREGNWGVRAALGD